MDFNEQPFQDADRLLHVVRHKIDHLSIVAKNEPNQTTIVLCTECGCEASASYYDTAQNGRKTSVLCHNDKCRSHDSWIYSPAN